jgi:hypothetical protein
MMLVISDTRVERGTIHGDVYVRDGGDLTLRGVIDGTLTVGIGGYAQVNGTVGSLVVRDAGGARLDGTCQGHAQNLGGDLTITGTVGGQIIGHYHS